MLRWSGGGRRGASASGRLRLVLVEDCVHGFSALGDHRLELVPVDLLGNCRGGVPDEISDVLDGYAIVAQDGHERMPQFARRPVVADPGTLGDRLERAAYVRGIKRCADLAREDESEILPQRA